MEKKKWNARKIRYWVTLSVLIAIIITCIGIIAYKLITDAKNQEKYEDIADMMESAAQEESRTRPSLPTSEPSEPVEESTEPSSEPTNPSEESTEPSEDLPPEISLPQESRPAMPTVEPSVEPSEPAEPSTEPSVEPSTEPTEPPSMLLQYQMLYNINTDTVGWINIPGTSIDYPVVQSPYEKDFYLRKDFYKQKATCGTIYVREKCDVFKPSDNLTIYGHNMRNGTMFADLHKYESKSFWENNRYVLFDTLYEYHAYEIFAVFISSADLSIGFSYHTFDDARTQAEFDYFVGRCKELSLYDTGITPQYGDKLITLSTCDKSIEEGRFVVVARRVY